MALNQPAYVTSVNLGRYFLLAERTFGQPFSVRHPGRFYRIGPNVSTLHSQICTKCSYELNFQSKYTYKEIIYNTGTCLNSTLTCFRHTAIAPLQSLINDACKIKRG